MEIKKELVIKLNKSFDNFSHIEGDIEYWYARDLQSLLGSDRWENFINPIEKAKTACMNSDHDVIDHFRDVTKMVELGSGSKREISDILLTRYACYLIAQNGDPKKEEIAFAQTYFAVQTRRLELIEQRLAEIERIRAREKLAPAEDIKKIERKIKSDEKKALSGGKRKKK